MHTNSSGLGFTERFQQEATLFPDLFLGRVVSQFKDSYKVATETSELIAEISGKFRYSAQELSDYPTVGDFVMLDRDNDKQGNAIIHNVLTRKSVFIRRAAGTSHDVQLVAANIDTVFICMSLNNDFNIRRLERYLSIAWDSGAVPVIVLTKSDLCDDLESKLSEVSSIAYGADVIVTSGIRESGYEAILNYIKPDRTIAFIGSSGVGKSTLINRLLGEEAIETQGIRKDDKGRHTTTRRELLTLPNGSAVIDTPGMRELGVDSVNLSKTFSDIEELATQCRFKDCEHKDEPGCAVRKGIEDGFTSEERLESYNKLKKEARYDGLNSKQIEKVKIEEMFSDFGGIKNARNYAKSTKKGRNQ